MTEFRGRLYVFVDTVGEASCTPSTEEPEDIFALRQPGQMLWYLNGWAVSRNVRGNYCARTSVTKLRTFATFAEAMDCVRKKRKARPTECFHLVYEVDGRKSIVTSLEQIQRQDGGHAHSGHPCQSDLTEHPVLEVLTGKVGKIVATNALILLRILDQEGESAARVRFSGATYDRLWQVLQQAALVAGSSSTAESSPS